MSLNCETHEDVIRYIEENKVQYVDLRFTDPRGKWQHLTQSPATIDEGAFTDGIFFDGSSIAGWKAINESDMALIPDPSTATMDPFANMPTMILVCNVFELVAIKQLWPPYRHQGKEVEVDTEMERYACVPAPPNCQTPAAQDSWPHRSCDKVVVKHPA